jgi:hypothetical protein
LLASRTINPISHGRTIMHQKTLIVHLAISQESICQRKNSKIPNMSQSTKLHSQDHLPSIQNLKASVEEVQALLKKNQSFKNQFLNLVPLKREVFSLQNSVDIMIEAIYLSESTIKILCQSLCGRFQLSPSTIIIICQYSLME